MKVVFMGTPEFAVASLDKIHNSEHEVVAVVTAPDKPSGRGRKLKGSAVKEYALEQNIPVLQPPKLKAPEFIEELQKLNADLFVVVAFRMLPEVVWNMPNKGTINLHGSLLPQYRGAAPIHRAVMNGETETGVSTFFIEKEIDTGDILLQEVLPIGPLENTGDVHDKMMVLGADVLLKTLDCIASNNIKPIKQDDVLPEDIKNAPKLFRNDCVINWNQEVNMVHNFIRGLSPFPSAWSMLSDKVLKIHAAKPLIEKHKLENGTIVLENDQLKVACLGGFILVEQLQLEGKKRMKIGDFIRGMQADSLHNVVLHL
ncbi:MAG: methionyl-tRNA formyltransferase [Flavobacteriales bacterium]